MSWLHVLGPITLLDRRRVLHACPEGEQFHLLPSKRRGGKAPRKTLPTVCGMERVNPFLVGGEGREGEPDTFTILWPPRLSVCRDLGYERCQECFVTTGRPRPNRSWDDVRKAEAAA